VYYKQYNYKSYFVAKVSKLLALINYSYRNFSLGGVIKKVEAPKTALLYYKKEDGEDKPFNELIKALIIDFDLDI